MIKLFCFIQNEAQKSFIFDAKNILHLEPIKLIFIDLKETYW